MPVYQQGELFRYYRPGLAASRVRGPVHVVILHSSATAASAESSSPRLRAP
jgi:hypothetical protein